MKRNILIVLVLMISAVTLFACNNDDASGDGSVNEEGKVTLNAIMLKHALTQELSKMEWLKEAEERAGVSIKWEEVTSDWDQKKGPMLSGGDVPDLIIGPNAITDADFAQFPGLFEDLTELINEHGPNVNQMFEEKPETKVMATQLDGKIYGLPKYQRFWPETSTRQYINQEWLDNLGLEVPTTWDELYEVLLAFKNEDANGNGDPNDEIPMDFAPVGTGGFGFFHPTVLLGSTGITISGGGGQGYFVEDGVVKNFFTDDRYKEFVKFLNRLWEAGVINSEVFTQDYTKYQSLARGSEGVAKVGFTWGWEVTDRFGNEVSPQYVSIPPLKVSESSDVQVSWTYDYYSLNYGTNMVTMSAQSKNKEAAMKFINELYDPIVSMQVLFGSLGTNIEESGGSYKVLPPEDPSMDPGTWKWTSTWADNGPMYISDSLDLTLGEDMQSVGEQTEPLSIAFSSLDTEKDLFPPFVKYSQEENNELSLTNTSLMNVAMAKFSQWITEGEIDAEWDGYVQELERIGIDRTIEIMQKYYDQYYE